MDLELTEDDLELDFPSPDRPLADDPGEPVVWSDFMDQIAVQTVYYLTHYGAEPVSPLPATKFSL